MSAVSSSGQQPVSTIEFTSEYSGRLNDDWMSDRIKDIVQVGLAAPFVVSGTSSLAVAACCETSNKEELESSIHSLKFLGEKSMDVACDKIPKCVDKSFKSMC